MKNTLETRLGLFVALAVLAAAIILERVGSFESFRHGKHVNALFNNVQDLKVGDRVKMAGVEIGRVEDIQLDHQSGAGHDESARRRRSEDRQHRHHQVHRLARAELRRH